VKRKTKLGPDHPDTLRSMIGLAEAYRDSGQLAKALPLVEETLQKTKAKLGAEHPLTLRTMTNLGLVLLQQKKWAEAEPAVRDCLAIRRKQFPDSWLTFNTQSLLGGALLGQKKYLEAEPLLLQGYQGLKTREQTIPAQGRIRIPEALDRLIELYTAINKPDEAKKWQAERAKYPQGKTQTPELVLLRLEETLKRRQAKLGPDHPDTLNTMNQLGVAYWSKKQLDRSIPLFEGALKLSEKKLGRDDPFTLRMVANLGVNYKDAGRLKEALALLEEAYAASKKHSQLRWVVQPLLEAYTRAGQPTEKAKRVIADLLADARKQLAKDSPQLASPLAVAGLYLLQIKAFAEAEPICRECLTIRAKTQPEAWSTFNTQSLLGGSLLGQKKYAEAEPLLLKGYAGLKKREKSIPPQAAPRLREAVQRLVQLYEATAKKDEAAKWRKELDAIQAANKKPRK
jgi:hypothetical protein